MARTVGAGQRGDDLLLLEVVHARLDPLQYDAAGSAHLLAQRLRLTGLLVRRRGRATEYDLLGVSEILFAPPET